MLQSYAYNSRFFSHQALQPHVRVWDSVSLNTLHVIGAGVIDRAVTCVAFSKLVSVFLFVFFLSSE